MRRLPTSYQLVNKRSLWTSGCRGEGGLKRAGCDCLIDGWVNVEHNDLWRVYIVRCNTKKGLGQC